MIEVREFHPDDVDRLELQHHQVLEMRGLPDWRSHVRTAGAAGPAWTAELAGRVIGCAGVALVWNGRARTWCLLAGGIPRTAWIGIHRAVLVRLAQLPALGIWRVEANVVRGFLPGDRWVRMLGFEFEGTARAYGPDGADWGRYARIIA